MRTLIILITGLLVVGCGKTDTERLEEENRRLKAQLENDKLKADLEPKPNPVKELTLREKVIGTYERKSVETSFFITTRNTYRHVFLDNSIVEWYENGKNQNADSKWSIVDKEIYIELFNTPSIGILVQVYRLNPDNSINMIAVIRDGKRTDRAEENQYTYIKIN